ncbi:alpha-ketoglutarate-dependent dioxygenase AlkB [Psychrosphaera aquimarina]|uniref:Alpha-ketoglutarate-dependent dioxygenase AlkB n=1 Tax=Psychrosphaera aquimarina TaxID=2044854 RepID=A0ABU3R3I2_9GAMM|nr:alpha-ketoglutarate-dependent dioxygenase AlkB [Psychrosphaera aquimarina]MDU0113990.1 alpha-ketoglutarate-dependent dioxygenase AlkB [Psychrosphaera aquimarina]
MQFDLFEIDSQNSNKSIKLPRGFVYVPNFMDPLYANDAFNYLLSNLSWQQPTVEVYGKKHLVPRLQSWMGEVGTHYQYSGKLFESTGWEQVVFDIKTRAEKLTKKQFNSALINLYRDGQDKMGWHADDEKELGLSPAVVTVSLGIQRTFQFKHNIEGETFNLELAHGSLLLMKPGVQASYKHAIPARKKVERSRISLTFRNIIN